MRPLALIFLTGFIVTAGAVGAVESLQPVQAAVGKSLAFLEKEGVKWHEDKSCLSCHHIPFMAWTHLEAGRHGLAVDQAKLKEWLGWCVEWAEPKGGDDVLAELLLFLPREVMPEPEAQKKFASLPATLLSKQKPDGSWAAAGQFRTEQWPAREADEATTVLMLLGLNTPWAEPAKTASAREKALAWLKTNEPVQATRSLALRLLLHHHMGDSDSSRRDALTKTLLSHQKPDGGWSWKIGEEGSDPLATGELLYVLSVAGSPGWEVASRQRAVEYLLESQLEDGSWYQDHKRVSAKIRPEAKPTVDGIYSYLATGWATMGLLQGLPSGGVGE